jgi:uncharacterized protein involved in exopolysaccharide biosynthesis
LTKRDIIIFVFKWEKSLFGYWFFIIALSVFLVYALPQKYEAVAKLLIEGNRAPVMRADVAFGAEQMNVLNSEVAIIRSKPVFAATAAKVAAIKKALKGNTENEVTSSPVREVFGRLGQWTLDVGLREASPPREQLISDLENGLKVAPQPNSNVIAMSYKSADPEMAAIIVNTITESYINQHLKIFSSIGTSEVYRLQIERLEKDLSRRRKELVDYKRDKSVSALNETMRAQVQQQTNLTSELSVIERELAELRTRFGKGHTKVVLAEERLRSTRQLLDEISKKLQSLEVEEATIRDMEIEINSIELTIQNYKKLFQDEQMVNLANPEVINVLIIEKAVAPSRPGRSRLSYIILATLGGLLLSFAIAFIKEYFDHRVTDPKVASQLLGVPTLGSIEKA